MLVDSHAHLNFYDDSVVENILARAKKAGIEKIINIGTSLEDSKRAIEQAEKYENVYATIGIHPNDNPEITAETVDWEEFKRLTGSSKKVVGIGECGLDYTSIRLAPQSDSHRTRSARFPSEARGSYSVLSIQYKNEIKRQKQLFLRQLELAHELKLPVSIHVRDAYDDMIALAKNIRTNAVFHCFFGTHNYLNALLAYSPVIPGEDPGSSRANLDSGSVLRAVRNDRQFYFSFAGNITFRKAHDLLSLAQLVPLERLLVETDCPFLTPEPFRGEQNEPANVKIVAEKLAEIKGISFAELARLTADNARILFNIKQ